MSQTPNIGFVIAAYAVAAAVLIGMVVAVFIDYRSQRKALRRLESGRSGVPSS